MCHVKMRLILVSLLFGSSVVSLGQTGSEAGSTAEHDAGADIEVRRLLLKAHSRELRGDVDGAIATYRQIIEAAKGEPAMVSSASLSLAELALRNEPMNLSLLNEQFAKLQELTKKHELTDSQKRQFARIRLCWAILNVAAPPGDDSAAGAEQSKTLALDALAKADPKDLDAPDVRKLVAASAGALNKAAGHEDCMKLLDTLLLRVPSAESLVYLQRLRLQTLLASEHHQAAMEAARLLLAFDVATDSDFAADVALSATALLGAKVPSKTVSGYTAFQKWGPAGPDAKPGTSDDLRNPLPPFAGEAKTTSLHKLAEKLQSASDSGVSHRQKGYLCLIRGQTDEALAAFKKALQESPLLEHEIHVALNDIAVALAARDGHIFDCDRYAKFVYYGASGPDGKAGTADDLIDPLASTAP